VAAAVAVLQRGGADMGRRIAQFLALTCAAAMLAVACGGDGDTTDPNQGAGGNGASPTETPSGTLRLFSYSDGFDPEYMKTFFEQYPDIELETSAFGSNDEAVAKILAGFEADVINSCVDEATLEMVQRGMYQPLDVSRLEHWDEIWPAMKELPGVQVDGEVYMVPVDAGTAGIMYNADVVTTPPTSWADLFDPQWAGRASIEDLSITAIDIGAFVNGIENPLEMTPDQLEMVKNYLIDHRDQFRTFWKGEADIKAQFKSGEVVIASGYPGTAKSLRKEGVNVQFAIAEEGQMLWACGYGISPDAENIDAAYALLNWYTSLPPQIYAAENWNYITSNMGIVDAVSSDVIDDAGLLAFQEGDTSVNAIPASPPEDRQAWVAAWTEVKAG
jgi:spermidine/putrescine-binding protein